MAYSFEIGPIRPPNESNSLLIRLTRNCPWNKCKFCNSYKGKRFQSRTVPEIKQDIDVARILRDKIMEITLKSGHSGGMQKVVKLVLQDPPNESFRNVALWLLGGGENVFLQDANSLAMKTSDLGEVIVYLKETFPKVKRITSYARSQTAMKKNISELIKLRTAGLTRLHVGLESGYDPVLEFMQKGETVRQHILGGRKIVDAGISLSEYVILGLGGKELSALHAKHTALALNQIDPEFIRIRTLCINNAVPLSDDVISGSFIRATDEEIINEERTFIENLNVHSTYVSDHISNLLPELEGKLPEDKNRLISIIDRFTALPGDERINFMIGRRVGLYKALADMDDTQRHDLVEQIKYKLIQEYRQWSPEIIFTLMEEFI
ncbi:MAG: radical SAM protein [Dehalococcoidales bacterium]|nr:radical SAM protein [Dehalococcoidales bacterium]